MCKVVSDPDVVGTGTEIDKETRPGDSGHEGVQELRITDVAGPTDNI